ncbi:MAG: TetR/AcrR family transcriptional regulator [Actinomycetota bacterium]
MAKAPASDSDARPPRAPLSRDKVIGAAIRVMDTEGLEAVTMRRIGRELGVEAMSLYNHVEDKGDLLVGMLEHLMGGLDLPADDEDWVGRLREMARSFRRLLAAHPHALGLFSEHHARPMTDPRALAPIEQALSILRSSGLETDDVIHAYCLFVGYVIGFTTNELAGFLSHRDDDAPGLADKLRALPTHEMPTLAAILPRMAERDVDADFEFGLDVILSGLQQRVGR